MGLLDSLIRRGRQLEVDSLAEPTGWLSRLGATGSGVPVTEISAMNFSAVHASVGLLADSLAMLPAKVYRRAGDGVQPVAEHPAAPLLTTECNPETTAFVGRQVVQAQALLSGYGYAEIERDKADRPLALWPIHWRRVTPKRHPTSGELVYDVAAYHDNGMDGSVRQGAPRGAAIPETNMLRIPGLSLLGLSAVSPIQAAREVVGAGLAADGWLAAFFGNGAWPGGWVKTQKAFKSADDRTKYLESLQARHQGVGRAFRIGLLEEGAEFVAATIPAEQAQLLELRVDLRREIARLYRIPPHLIGDLERATFSNIEEQGIQFVVYTLLPWMLKWEQELGRKLLTTVERQTHYFKLNAGALLRGNLAARYEAYSKGIQSGFMAPDEVRALEDMNPIPEGKGQTWLFPKNMEQVAGPAQQPKKTAGRSVQAFVRLLPDEMARARRAAQRAAAKALDGAGGSPLDLLYPTWERSRAEARRTLAGSVRAACHAAALETCDDATVEVVAERAAQALVEELSAETAASLRAAAEAAYASATKDGLAAVRAALAAEAPWSAPEVERLLRRVEECVSRQGGDHGAE